MALLGKAGPFYSSTLCLEQNVATSRRGGVLVMVFIVGTEILPKTPLASEKLEDRKRREKKRAEKADLFQLFATCHHPGQSVEMGGSALTDASAGSSLGFFFGCDQLQNVKYHWLIHPTYQLDV